MRDSAWTRLDMCVLQIDVNWASGEYTRRTIQARFTVVIYLFDVSLFYSNRSPRKRNICRFAYVAPLICVILRFIQ